MNDIDLITNYVIDYSKEKIPSKFGKLDSNGIPLFDSRILRLSLGYIYHPMVILQYGLANYELILKGNQDARVSFIKCVDWLKNNAILEPKGRFKAWYYSFPISPLQDTSPWISGMQQGQALSLLLRAYQYTGSVEIGEVAQSVANSFLYDLQDGGIISRTILGNSFIEEYAFIPASHVLNGCLYSIIGLYEYLTIFPNTKLNNVMKNIIQGIEEVLPDFDLGWWSKYSLGLRWNLASLHYHNVHVQLLFFLYKKFDLNMFLHFASKWKSYEMNNRNVTKLKLLGFIEVNINRSLKLLRLKRVRYVSSKRFINN